MKHICYKFGPLKFFLSNPITFLLDKKEGRGIYKDRLRIFKHAFHTSRFETA